MSAASRILPYSDHSGITWRGAATRSAIGYHGTQGAIFLILPWWKRLIYSFISVIVSGSFVGTVVSCRDALLDGYLHPMQVFVGGCIVALFSLPGWLVAIPIVVIVKDYSGWRLWACAIAGVCIGPVLILGLAIYAYLTNPRSSGFAQGSSVFLVLATAVSVLATIIYLLLARDHIPWAV